MINLYWRLKKFLNIKNYKKLCWKISNRTILGYDYMILACVIVLWAMRVDY